MTTSRLFILFLSCCAVSALSFWSVDRWLMASPYQENDVLPWDGFLEYAGRPFDGVIPMVVHVRGSGEDEVFTQVFPEVAVHGGLFRVLLGCTGEACAQEELLPRWATTQLNVRIEAQVGGALLQNDHRVGTVAMATEADRYGELRVRGNLDVDGSLSAPSVTASEGEVGGDLTLTEGMTLGPRRGDSTSLVVGGALQMPAGTLQTEWVRLVGANPQINNPEGDRIRFAAGPNHTTAPTVMALAPSGSTLLGSLHAPSLRVSGDGSEALTVATSGSGTLIRREAGGQLVLGGPSQSVFIDPRISIRTERRPPGYRVQEYEPGFSGEFSGTFGDPRKQVCWLSRVVLKPNELNRTDTLERVCTNSTSCGEQFACHIESTGTSYRFRRVVRGPTDRPRSAVRACSAVCLELPGGF